jgi:hypothetical protein
MVVTFEGALRRGEGLEGPGLCSKGWGLSNAADRVFAGPFRSGTIPGSRGGAGPGGALALGLY